MCYVLLTYVPPCTLLPSRGSSAINQLASFDEEVGWEKDQEGEEETGKVVEKGEQVLT